MRIIVSAFIATALVAIIGAAKSADAAQPGAQAPVAASAPAPNKAVVAKVETRVKGALPRKKIASHKKKSWASSPHRRAKFAVAASRAAGLTKSHAPFYTPLVRPGMPSRYDIAGWHGAKPSDLSRAVAFDRKSRRAAANPTDPSAWYSPQTRPGMLNRYDLRDLHASRLGRA